MKVLISSCALALGLAMGLSACTDPYDPGQRAIGGGLFGAAAGAAIGGIAGGGPWCGDRRADRWRIGRRRGRCHDPRLLRLWLQRIWLQRLWLQRLWLQRLWLQRTPLLRIWGLLTPLRVLLQRILVQ